VRVRGSAQQVVRADARKLCVFTSRRARRGSTPSLGGKARMKMSGVGTLLERPSQALGRLVGGVSASPVVCSVAPWLRSTAQGVRNVESVLQFDRVASIGAQLRSAAVFRTVGVRRSQLNVALE
jgi:hypothetical protein